MELALTLESQTIQNQAREVGINENYWYPVAWADQLKAGQVIPVKIWQKSIAVYRDTQGQCLSFVCLRGGCDRSNL